MKLSVFGLAAVAAFGFSGSVLANTPAQLVNPVARPAAIEQETRPQFAVFVTSAPGLKRSLRPQAKAGRASAKVS